MTESRHGGHDGNYQKGGKMANCEMLKALIEQRGLKQRYIAQQMGVSDKKMHELLNGGRWRLDEVVSFCSVMNLSKKQREDIFFTQNVGV